MNHQARKIQSRLIAVTAALAIAMTGVAGASGQQQVQPLPPSDILEQTQRVYRDQLVLAEGDQSRQSAGDSRRIMQGQDSARMLLRDSSPRSQLDVAPRLQLRDACLAECKRLGHPAAQCEQGC